MKENPRERFKRKVAVLNDTLKFIKQTPVHPRDRLRRRTTCSSKREVDKKKQKD